MLSFVIAAIACGLAALFASTIPVAGSIYTYSYATLGELVAWIIGWDLMLEYGLASSAVSVGWSDLQSLLQGFRLTLPTVLTAAPGAVPGVVTWFNLPAFLVMIVITTLLSIGIRESTRINNIMVFIKVSVVLLDRGRRVPCDARELEAVHAARLERQRSRGGDVLRVHRLRRGVVGGRGRKRALPIGIIASLAVCAVRDGRRGRDRHRAIGSISQSYALQKAGETWVAASSISAPCLTVILLMSYERA